MPTAHLSSCTRFTVVLIQTNHHGNIYMMFVIFFFFFLQIIIPLQINNTFFYPPPLPLPPPSCESIISPTSLIYSQLLTHACLQNKLSELVFSLTQINITLPPPPFSVSAFSENTAGVYRHVETVGDGSFTHIRTCRNTHIHTRVMTTAAVRGTVIRHIVFPSHLISVCATGC